MHGNNAEDYDPDQEKTVQIKELLDPPGELA
jgi:hypothetical protein